MRFGDGAISGYKAVGIRWSLVNKLNFDPSEHGMIKRKLNPDTGLWEEDPEIDPDAEFPDVYEGIVYKDKVLTLMGEEMADSDEEVKDVDKSDDDDGSAMAV